MKEKLSNFFVSRKNLNCLVGKSCAVSWSGGKDSALSVYFSLQVGAKVEAFINMKVKDKERSSGHRVRSNVIQEQAKAAGVKLFEILTDWNDYETNFITILEDLKKMGIEACILGNIDLLEHLEWEKSVCKKAGIIPVLPLWNERKEKIIYNFIHSNFEARILSIKKSFLSSGEFLGSVFDFKIIEKFKKEGIDICGEYGEYHTIVVNGPIFKFPLQLSSYGLIDDEQFLIVDYAVKKI